LPIVVFKQYLSGDGLTIS